MDSSQYTSLLEALEHVPDPRKAKGKQHEWRIILAVLCAAVASGERSVRGIAQWSKEHEAELIQHLRPATQRLPSAATLYRVMRSVDVASVEKHLARLSYLQEHSEHKVRDKRQKRQHLVGQSVDGKELRGARAHGRPICLVSLVRHSSGRVMAQQSVDQKRSEITAVPYLLQGQELRGTVTTMDALLTQRAIAQQIVEGGGHYLMGVKANQGELYAATEELFAAPPWLSHEREANYRSYTKVEKGHGRLEKRTLESSPAMREYLQEYLHWPGGEQVMRRTCQREIVSSGEISEEIKYAVTSLRWEEADAAELERLWRGHWTIENRVHHVRDVTMGEDANQMRVGNAPQVLAALHNAVLNLIRSEGWTNVADGLRHYSAFAHRALALVTSPDFS